MKKLLSLLLAASMLLSLSVVSFGATDALVEDIIVNKNMLSTAISTGTSYYMSLDNFTSGSWNYLMWELEDARRVHYDKKATQAEVYLATQELT